MWPTLLITSWVPVVLGIVTPGNLRRNFLRHLLGEPHFTYDLYRKRRCSTTYRTVATHITVTSTWHDVRCSWTVVFQSQLLLALGRDRAVPAGILEETVACNCQRTQCTVCVVFWLAAPCGPVGRYRCFRGTFLYCNDGVKLCSCGNAAANGPMAPSPDDTQVTTEWNDTNTGKPKHSKKNPTQCHFVHIVGVNPGLRGGKLATNSPCYGTAFGGIYFLHLQGDTSQNGNDNITDSPANRCKGSG
jgi:hypothetical protein